MLLIDGVLLFIILTEASVSHEPRSEHCFWTPWLTILWQCEEIGTTNLFWCLASVDNKSITEPTGKLCVFPFVNVSNCYVCNSLYRALFVLRVYFSAWPKAFCFYITFIRRNEAELFKMYRWQRWYPEHSITGGKLKYRHTTGFFV